MDQLGTVDRRLVSPRTSSRNTQNLGGKMQNHVYAWRWISNEETKDIFSSGFLLFSHHLSGALSTNQHFASYKSLMAPNWGISATYCWIWVVTSNIHPTALYGNMHTFFIFSYADTEKILLTFVLHQQCNIMESRWWDSVLKLPQIFVFSQLFLVSYLLTYMGLWWIFFLSYSQLPSLSVGL